MVARSKKIVLVYFLITILVVLWAGLLVFVVKNKNVVAPPAPYEGFIHPFCFAGLGDNDFVKGKVINITKCNEEAKNAPYKIDPKNSNFVGAEYPREDDYYAGYIDYNIFATTTDKMFVYFIESGGGTGRFTNIQMFKRSGDTLEQIDTIPGGDRCNGGIEEYKLEGNIVLYSHAVTPSAIISEVEKKYSPDYELDDYAVACYGSMHFKYDIDTKTKSFDYLEFGGYDFGRPVPVKGKPLPANLTTQECFDSIANDYESKGMKKLSYDELVKFDETFRQKCVKKEDLQKRASSSPSSLPTPPMRACTMEAKQCPDGSYVGRTGPNCEFSPCP